MPRKTNPARLLPDGAAAALMAGTHADPFAILGPHPVEGGVRVTAVFPDAQTVTLVRDGDRRDLLVLEHDGGVFAGLIEGMAADAPYRLEISRNGYVWQQEDPYRFGSS
ncbi:MAG: hypothetical protein MUF14_06450, partial [Hyphomonadaceae bacterium]|nr:hypothetical protein [Hyphomonadaceae bacterium]